MRVQRFSDADAFLERAGPWLLRSEAEHNLILGLAERSRTLGASEPPIYLAAVEHQGVVQGCAFRTPPWKVVVTGMPPEAVRDVVDDVARTYETITGVLGPPQETALFASRWTELRGVPAHLKYRQGVYQLERLIPPSDPPAGVLRLASRDDLGIALDWGGGFVRDIGLEHTDAHVRRDIEEKIDSGTLWFWDDGRPRSMAARGSRTPNGARVNWVFTPPKWRGRGYASACVAAVSQGILDDGLRFCFLFTDLANPTSNSIYSRIGYEKVCEMVDYGF